jgi:transcriptional regulator with GAF, ATPase, and Fis domain
MINENKFFKEMALRICGSLDIESALWNCYLYVRDIIPTDALTVTFYYPEEAILEIVATANSKGGFARSDKIPIPPQLRKQLEDPEKYPRVRICNDVYREDDLAGLVAKKMDCPDSSVIVVRFIVDGKLLGSLNARVTGTGRYTDNHLHLWSLVNEPFAVALSNTRKYRELVKLKERLADSSKYFENELRKNLGDVVIGADLGLKGVMAQIQQVAPSSSPVLLFGETGTGKELLANVIHKSSPRHAGPLIKVNCGAIPESLIDSELFGHEKGSFTGALSQKRGRFERADGGTIFLDEVSELPLNAQVRLLRVLQEKEFERVGGTSPVKVDIRIISATNKPLIALVEKGAFRDDLYYRLGVFPIHMPQLKHRKMDIPALVDHFMMKKAQEMGFSFVPRLAPGAIEELMSYDWPGNVRELNNAVERALLVYRDKPMQFAEILGLAGRSNAPDESPVCESDLLLNSVEARHIRRILEKTEGRVEGPKGAAAILGLKPGTLRHRMRKLGVPFGRVCAKGMKT